MECQSCVHTDSDFNVLLFKDEQHLTIILFETLEWRQTIHTYKHTHVHTQTSDYLSPWWCKYETDQSRRWCKHVQKKSNRKKKKVKCWGQTAWNSSWNGCYVVGQRRNFTLRKKMKIILIILWELPLTLCEKCLPLGNGSAECMLTYLCKYEWERCLNTTCQLI